MKNYEFSNKGKILNHLHMYQHLNFGIEINWDFGNCYITLLLWKTRSVQMIMEIKER